MLNGTLTLTDNALDVTGATQAFTLTGIGFTKPTTSMPTVVATPASTTITAAQTDVVIVKVTSANGSPTPTGTVTLSGGNYSSPTVTLSGGSASFTISAGALALGSSTLNAIYIPDAASLNIYGGAPAAPQSQSPEYLRRRRR